MSEELKEYIEEIIQAGKTIPINMPTIIRLCQCIKYLKKENAELKAELSRKKRKQAYEARRKKRG